MLKASLIILVFVVSLSVTYLAAYKAAYEFEAKRWEEEPPPPIVYAETLT